MSDGLKDFTRERDGRLRYSNEIGRYVLDGWELHCGDCFEVLLGQTWQAVRIEMAQDWYLQGPGVTCLIPMEGLRARSLD
jgi:hypothetical protein